MVIALGPSTDRTDEIAAELVRRGPAGAHRPQPHRPYAGGAERRHQGLPAPVVVRVDGHGMLSPDYIATAVRLLEETGAQNVGGIMHAEGENDWERPSPPR